MQVYGQSIIIAFFSAYNEKVYSVMRLLTGLARNTVTHPSIHSAEESSYNFVRLSL